MGQGGKKNATEVPIYFILTVKILVVIKSDGTFLFFFYFCQLVFSDNSTLVTFFFKTYTSLFFGC